MPSSDIKAESDTRGDRRSGGRLLTVVFWIGVSLAPLAALLLLLGHGAGLRAAAVLALLAIVLIGLSIGLRRDAESVRLELESTFLDEIDLIREDARADIATAARATHKAFGEKLQVLYQDIQAMRGQLEAIRAAGHAPRVAANGSRAIASAEHGAVYGAAAAAAHDQPVAYVEQGRPVSAPARWSAPPSSQWASEQGTGWAHEPRRGQQAGWAQDSGWGEEAPWRQEASRRQEPEWRQEPAGQQADRGEQPGRDRRQGWAGPKQARYAGRRQHAEPAENGYWPAEQGESGYRYR